MWRRVLILAVAAAVCMNAQKRIVSTAPAITETLFALGLGDRVAGVSTYCHYPPEALSRPKIGDYLQPNVEAILRLKPDLLIMEKLADPAVVKLRAAGVKVTQISTGDLAVNLKMIEDIASAAGVADKGRAMTAQIRADLQALRTSAQKLPKRKVVFVVGRLPGRLEGIIAVGKGSYLNELIEAAGGENVLSTSPLTYPKVSLEALVRMQPDVILDMGDMAETTGVSEEHKKSVVALWKSRSDLRANVHAVASDIFVVPGPRMADATRELRTLIHGGRRP